MIARSVAALWGILRRHRSWETLAFAWYNGLSVGCGILWVS